MKLKCKGSDEIPGNSRKDVFTFQFEAQELLNDFYYDKRIIGVFLQRRCCSNDPFFGYIHWFTSTVAAKKSKSEKPVSVSPASVCKSKLLK